MHSNIINYVIKILLFLIFAYFVNKENKKYAIIYGMLLLIFE